MEDINVKDVNYAHNDTSKPERESRTLSLNVLKLDDDVQNLRRGAFARRIPVSDDETLAFLCLQAKIKGAKSVLELGTAIGVSAICLARACPTATITTVEKNADFYAEALQNVKNLGCEKQVSCVFADAGEFLQNTNQKFDFIFMDSAKVQYVKYLPRLKRVLTDGGIIFADDVLLYGWVNGETPVPTKRKMLVQHVREYIDAVNADGDLTTSIIDVGNGVALSIKN